MAKNPKKRTKIRRLNSAIKDVQSNQGEIASFFDLDTFDYIVGEFSSLDDIFKDIKKRIHYGVDWAARYCYEALSVAVEHWYNDYSPVKYTRTETLYEAPNVWVSGYGGHVSFGDYPNMMIGGKKPSEGMAILYYAEQGIHGVDPDWQDFGEKEIGIWGEFIDYLENGTWSYLKGGGQAMSPELDEAPMVYLAFNAGIFTGGKAPFGRK